jgi:predicted nucleic acid-binding Zn ribbon protein
MANFPKNDMSLGEAIKAYLKAMGLDKKLKENALISSWEEVMGKTVAKVTKSITLQNQVLYVQLNSSVARHQLQMMKSGIIDALNKKAGEQMVKDIIFR